MQQSIAASKAGPKEISYSFSARSRAGRTFIRSIENVTGRPRLLRMADGYEREVEAGRNFWEVMQERYGISLDFVNGGLENIPREGPLVVVANHPYGILDGLAIGRILQITRGDFKIIANTVFKKSKELDRSILPIDFAETKEAQRLNIATRKEALSYLADGGAVAIFPGGTVSTAARPFARAMDPPWKPFTARMIAKSQATVVPVYFEGSNSRLFQVASHLHYTLRMALLISEFEMRVGGPIRVRIGKPLPRAEIKARASDARALMDYLRERTYRLSPKPIRDVPYGLYLG
ncbi:GNAT family N-acetyltransferase [Paralimibaculum aggregatum]|uniref:GNAT family N-acetyltransferase n=1 Tax=Paralimibaculum aggregatum TaxID=3036245 RepID=A0ABQ6LR43_9RHOB|nr:lysophospholipid acyltransferase family protein [Limibaculum sp. NKW23]GMG84742.1 GNAT family N-acetyltransferase [Limibaculum sp. NKW23]